ncbi:MaoC/PaaZ C-terminal domain-containing protein [Fulvimonas soli]|uniref:MaoC dehydratase-like protein n=1 Tax=Fulvimonas soli TaxID=155197 RepID=A0A316IFW3_9GAMM|nr:MaoC/PaaZ C-terminal domain-containing protein [Fulvimonas soli]PWK91913.1 MaoC dehydratase-like protein [Fulvimonas soli]TNY26040.1 hypothetical protein BV497_10825 [Fulvimonas soli]
MSLDYEKLLHWPFAQVRRPYTRADVVRFATGFGAGLPGPLQLDDAPFVHEADPRVLPPVIVALADGEFWQQQPETGIQWQKLVHAEEALTLSGALPSEGELLIDRRIVAIHDRGAARGAAIVEQQVIRDARTGSRIATIDVTTVARGDGGFGGPAEPARERVAMPDRPPDAVIELATPAEEGAIFRLPAHFAVASANAGERPQSVLRGLCCFGLAGRAVLKLWCDNRPERLRKLAVRYVGTMCTGETMRVESWTTGPGRAVFRMRSVERDAPVLDHGLVRFEP